MPAYHDVKKVPKPIVVFEYEDWCEVDRILSGLEKIVNDAIVVFENTPQRATDAKVEIAEAVLELFQR